MKNSLFILMGWLIAMGLTNCSDPNSTTIILNELAADYAGQQVPVHSTIDLPPKFQAVASKDLSVTLETRNGTFKDIPGQITQSEEGQYELWWMIPEIKKEESLQWSATIKIDSTGNHSHFTWKDTPGQFMDLLYHDRPLFRYQYILDKELDKEKTLTQNNKPFYHIFDLEGQTKITNGPEEGIWSHHRGIMFGWRDVKFEDQELSFWGMEDLTVQKHIEFTKTIAGPVFAQTEALIHWNDSTGRTLIEERRQATIFKQPDPNIVLLDFKSTINSTGPSITLNGDAEHGGVQFRASNDVGAELPGSKKPTYYFHEDNIDPKKDHNLPWVGMSYGLNNKTYSVLHINHPQNPKPAVWSAYRDYGRFGAYFPHQLEPGKPLTVQCRYWIGEEEMLDRSSLSDMYKAYINPVKISK
ncbi:DUF6807 family protein [Membranihabitans marinus]|uniref:DUF6807 family protein n=1 Tax=Membranihabitans marinus TaxID=1227546 RepID=UPI001F1D35AA|nr:DUF6807 family protein [Membranihabitans marinus]